MSPLDPVNPTAPSNWVRRVEDKRRPKDPKRRNPERDHQTHDQKPPPGPDPDGRTHIIDELA